MTESMPPAPIVITDGITDVAPGIFVIPDNGVPLVPNIGVVCGDTGVLVIDTGMGPLNARHVLDRVREIANDRAIYVTTTHFHPEHSYGISAFAPEATVLMNEAQLTDLQTKGEGYLEFFRTFGQSVAEQLVDVSFTTPDIVYEAEYDLDLGGRIVRMRATGQAHTKGDQVIRVPDASAVFCGDLVEESQFSIFPWFPPEDVDVSGTRWIGVMEGLLTAGDTLVIPGHGRVSGSSLLEEVHDYLQFLRDEAWSRKAAGMADDRITAEVYEMAKAAHPRWVGEEWIEKGVQCFCAEHDAASATS